MKVQEARSRLSNYRENELFQEARELYQKETDSRIQLRSYGKPPSRNVIEGVVNEMRSWMGKVGDGLPWDNDVSLQRIIKLETGSTWVRYGMTDPRVEEYAKRARLEILRGTPFPLAKVLTYESLDALFSMMLAQLQQEARKYFTDKEEKQE